MMINDWTATLSVNAGLALRSGDLRIWVDALHKNKVPDFSTLTAERQRLFFCNPEFRDPDVIFFSHCHPDHYSRELAEKAMKLYPNARLIMPAREEVTDDLPGNWPVPDQAIPGSEGTALLQETASVQVPDEDREGAALLQEAISGRVPEGDHDRQILLEGDEVIISIKEHQLIFRKLVHEGEQFRNVPNYGLMIEDGADRLLVLGDCAMIDEGLVRWISGKSIDTVFAPFPWITLKGSRKFLLEQLNPEQVVVCHLPLPEDDMYGYVKAARRAARELEDVLDIRLMTDPFQSEEL